MANESLTTSVVVTTVDRPDDLEECLGSLAGQTEPPDEVIVVDDGDRDHTTPVIAAADHEAIRHLDGPGEGLPAARNVGADAATGDVVGFLDDDVVVPPNWLAEILAVYREYEPAGVGGLVVNFTPPHLTKTARRRPAYRLLTAIRTLLFADRVGEIGPMGALYAPLTFNTTGVKPVDTLQGCNMTFASSILERHAFDEWYGRGGRAPAEELDFCTRVTADGGELYFTPRAVAVHKRTVGGGERTQARSHRNFRNIAYYLTDHSDHPIRDFALLGIYATVTSATIGSFGPIRAVAAGVSARRGG